MKSEAKREVSSVAGVVFEPVALVAPVALVVLLVLVVVAIVSRNLGNQLGQLRCWGCCKKFTQL